MVLLKSIVSKESVTLNANVHADCEWPFNGPFTVSVVISVCVLHFGMGTMQINRPIHSERDANYIAISVTLMVKLTLSVIGP